MASSSIFANAVDKVKFEQAYNNCIGAGDQDAKLVASFDLMLDLLKWNGFIDQMRLPPHRVGSTLTTEMARPCRGRLCKARAARLSMWERLKHYAALIALCALS